MPETPSVLLLHGNDELAIAAHIGKLCAGLGDPSTAGMNISRFDGRSGLDFEAFSTAVNAIPFLAPRRVVVLDHPGAAFSSSEAQEKLIKLLAKTASTTTVVLVEYELLKRDPRGNRKRDPWLLRWTDSAAGGVGVHVYNLPKRWEMPRWIESEAKKQGGGIDRDAAARLAGMVGEDTRVAAQELTKLLTYVNFERPIRLLDVEKVSIVSAQGNVFELVDALGQNNTETAQRVLHQLLEDEEAFELWGMVIRQFRLLLQAREMMDEHAALPQVQKELGLPDFVASKVCTQASHFSLTALESIYHKLLEIDEGAKTSQVPLDLALDTLIVELQGTA